MLIYRNDNTNPYFNIASEEYLIDNSREEIFMLWRNNNAVIIGRNQNAYAELNREFIASNGISVVRRLTGGGAVFHDLGNINFTFIVNESDGDVGIDFARFTEPIVCALKKIGIDAELSGRNDITAGGVKISGNAQCRRSGRIMHHGTLLFSADFSRMTGALNVDPDKMKSKGIKSVRSRVGNIAEFAKNADPDFSMDAADFKSWLEENVNLYTDDARICVFDEREKNIIQKLADEKYSSWDWNYGKSKSFEIVHKKYFSFGLTEIRLSTDCGIVSELEIAGDFFGVRDISLFCAEFSGIRFEYTDVLRVCADVGLFISGAQPEEIARLICGI